MSEQTIYIFGIDEDEGGGEQPAQRSLFRKKKASEIRYGRGQVPVDQLSAQVSSFLDSIGGVVDKAPENVGSFRLESVTISAEISAKGTVSLLGTGGELGGKAGLTFTLTRSVG